MRFQQNLMQCLASGSLLLWSLLPVLSTPYPYLTSIAQNVTSIQQISIWTKKEPKDHDSSKQLDPKIFLPHSAYFQHVSHSSTRPEVTFFSSEDTWPRWRHEAMLKTGRSSKRMHSGSRDFQPSSSLLSNFCIQRLKEVLQGIGIAKKEDLDTNIKRSSASHIILPWNPQMASPIHLPT